MTNASAGPGTSLNAKQSRFVQEYLIDLNATQAAIRAGYSGKTAEQQGPRLLGNVGVAAAIAKAQSERAGRVQVTQDYVLSSIVDTIERCKQAKPVLDRKGDPVLVETPTGDLVPAYTFDAGNVMRGAELLGKHLGMFKDGVNTEDAPALTVTIQRRAAKGEVRVTGPE